MLSHSWSITGRFFSRGIWIDHFPPSLLASSSQAGMMLSCRKGRHTERAGKGFSRGETLECAEGGIAP